MDACVFDCLVSVSVCENCSSKMHSHARDANEEANQNYQAVAAVIRHFGAPNPKVTHRQSLSQGSSLAYIHPSSRKTRIWNFP